MKQVLKSMTGIENQYADHDSASEQHEIKQDNSKQRESVPVAVSPVSRISLESSAISLDAINAAKEYLVNVYTTVTKIASVSAPPPEVTAKALKIDDSKVTEFIKDVSEESINSPGRRIC